MPADYADLQRLAALCDEYNVQSRDHGSISAVIVTSGNGAPSLVVAQHHSPDGPGFPLGLVIIPETNLMLIGAGERLLAYDLEHPRQLWEDQAEMGFWGFQRYGDVIVMSAELELAAWTLQGRKLWTTFVEPPWTYEVQQGVIQVDVMGVLRRFDLHAGPAEGS